MLSPKIRLCDTCSHLFSLDLLPSPKEIADLVEILRSNCDPSEPSLLRTVILSSPGELARYDTEIGRLQGILDKMQVARAALQSRYDTSRSIVAPVRRLPSEILRDIFALIPPDARSSDSLKLADIAIKEETRRVAQVHLLRLAGVCLRWRGLVMGDPVLWSEILLEVRYWECSHSPDRARMIALLSSVLSRGGNFPLTLHVGKGVGRLAPEPLKLLAQHSRRWRKVSLWIMDLNVRYLSPVKGQLSLLEALTIHGRSLNARGSDLLDLFGDAPRLTSLTFHGAAKALSTFSGMKQLQHFEPRVGPEQLGTALSFATILSRSARFVLGSDVGGVDVQFGLTPVVAHIQALVLNFMDHNMDHASKLLGEIFDNLTLDAQELSIISDTLTEWPLLQSLAFFSRSSLSHSLKVLEILYVIITEDALFQCLGELPALEKLVVSDQRSSYPDFLHHLITDSLLQRLTWKPDSVSCLVPRLNVLRFRTLFDFDDDIFLDFVLSRLESGINSQGPLSVTLMCYRDCQWELTRVVAEQLRKLQAQRKLVFSLSYNEQ